MAVFLRYLKRTLGHLVLVAVLALLSAMPAGADSNGNSSTETEGVIRLAAGRCSLEMGAAEISFGSWEWDGHKYVPLDESGKAEVQYRTTPPPRGGSCDITISSTGLFIIDSNSDDHIGPENFAVWVDLSGGENPMWVSFSQEGVVTLPWYSHTRSGVDLKVMNVPNDILPGTYKGTISFTVSSGQ